MNDMQIDELIQKLEKYRVRLSKSKKKSRQFLVEAGILTPKGNLKNNFKHLDIRIKS